jgi:hypothetical protein
MRLSQIKCSVITRCKGDAVGNQVLIGFDVLRCNFL